jgi:AcrR family transcriptional regulator
VGLRERHKDRRRRAIVAAASSLLNERGLDGLLIRDIAARAEVAPATVYNLVGGVSAIAAAVLSEAIAAIDFAPDADGLRASPLRRVIAKTGLVFEVFAARAGTVRPALLLYVTRRGTPEWEAERPMASLAAGAIGGYVEDVRAAIALGEFDLAIPAENVAATLFAALKTRIDAWTLRHLDDAEASRLAREDAALILLSGALGPAREAMLSFLTPPPPS